MTKVKKCFEQKNIEELMCNVLSSAGYEEISLPLLNQGKIRENMLVSMNQVECTDVERYSCGGAVSDDSQELCFGLFNESAIGGVAEVMSLAVESILALELTDVKVEISCGFDCGYTGECAIDKLSELKCEYLVKLYNILDLYGLSHYVTFKIESGNGVKFAAKIGEAQIGTGTKFDGCVAFSFNIDSIFKVLSEKKIDIGGILPEKTLIFAEASAYGIGYDLAFSIRQSGCMAIYYTGDGDFSAALEYAKTIDASNFIRVEGDGTVTIKDFKADEITKTDANTLLGYFEEEDEDEHHCHDEACGCHDEHHCHDEACSCHGEQ